MAAQATLTGPSSWRLYWEQHKVACESAITAAVDRAVKQQPEGGLDALLDLIAIEVAYLHYYKQ